VQLFNYLEGVVFVVTSVSVPGVFSWRYLCTFRAAACKSLSSIALYRFHIFSGQLVQDQELTIPEAARRLTMSDKTLANWVFRARRGQLAKLGESRRPVTELEAEVPRLKREFAEARMERDILKKATAYFAKAQLPGTHS